MDLDYHGHPALRVSSNSLSVDILSEAGPRLVGLRLAGSSENLLAELPDVHWGTPHGEYHIYGGHRLWVGPEDPEITYIPDDFGLAVIKRENGVELIAAAEPITGIRKSLRIKLATDGPSLSLIHRLVNEGSRNMVLAPWAITQLPLGGRVFLPQTRGAYPAGDPNAVFRPNRHFVLWNYSRWDDPRLEINDDHVIIAGKPRMPPLKIGYLNTTGWAAYLRSGTLFVKRIDPLPQQAHLDRSCNVEVYCNDAVLELETLGPSVPLAPGESVEHRETWQLISGIADGLRYPQLEDVIEKHTRL